jgi:sarcosine oxidase
VKAGLHDHGPRAAPDDWDAAPSDEELAPVRAALEALIPGATGPTVEREVCLYTNTVAADLRPDQGEEFIIDRLPSDPRIIVASPCSGHGAKFAPAIGEILASLALDPSFEADPAFRLGRYSRFAS